MARKTNISFLVALGLSAALLVAGLLCPVNAGAYSIAVEKVRVEGLHSIEASELFYLMDMAPGIAIDPDDVSAGIKRAFKKGIFESIVVEEEEAGSILVKVREKNVIKRIEIEGNEEIDEEFIREAFTIKEGDFLWEGGFDEAAEALASQLEKKGVAYARVELKVKKMDDPVAVRLLVRVHEGPTVRIDEVMFLGQADPAIFNRLEIKEGDPYDMVVIQAKMDELAAYLKGQGYLNPVVGPTVYTDGLLMVGVRPGRRLDIRIIGNRFVPQKNIREIMPFYEAGAFSDDLIDESISRLEELYRESGLVSVQVAPVVSEDSDGTTLSLFIFEGDRVKVGELKFSGATFDGESLINLMETKAGRPYDPVQLESDLENVREFYLALGYSSVKIEPPAVQIDGGEAKISISISEGSPTRISELYIKGLKVLEAEPLYQKLSVKPGSPYNEVDITDSRRNLLSACRSAGFINCEVNVERTLGEDGVKLEFNVNEGQIYFFSKIIVTGNTRTRSKVIYRAAEGLDGKPYDQSRLVKLRRKLYATSLFSNITIETIPNAADSTVEAEIRVEEGKQGVFEFGLGYGEYEKVRGYLELNYNNLFGMNRRGAVRTEHSSLWNRQIANFQEPSLFGTELTSQSYLLIERKTEKNLDTGEVSYRTRKKSASTGIEKMLDESTKVSLYYEYSIVDTYDVAPDVTLSKEDTGTLAIISLTPSIQYDTRDNPFDPRKGLLSGLSVQFASGLLLSETDFIKGTMQLGKYTSLGRRLVVAGSFRGGLAQGFSNTEELPLVERFFLGGRNTVRGFSQDSLGPKGEDGTPIGGNAFVLFNLELRFLLSKGWRLVPFVDAGNVWTDNADVSLSELRYSAGLGLQYNTPVGPIRLDYGQKINPEPDESKGELHFSLGYAF